MYIRDILKEKKPSISFEIFPPKKGYSVDTIYDTVDELKDLKPDFISVTYGAGGTSSDTTVDIASKIKRDFGIETIAHMTCTNSTKEEVQAVLKQLKDKDVKNILALRGDIVEERANDPKWNPEYHYASELIEDIHKFNGFSVGGACYPEGHIDATSKSQDLIHLKRKADMGLDFLISQLFFDNELFYDFMEKLEIMEVKVPVIAGILPVMNKNQIVRIQKLSGCSLPKKFTRIIDRYEHNPAALKEAGIAYAMEQIIDLLSWGIDGVHIYTMNKPKATRAIVENIENIRASLSNI